MESSIWVILWILYIQGYRRGALTELQLGAFITLCDETKLDGMLAEKIIISGTGDAFLQCPAVNRLINAVFRMAAPLAYQYEVPQEKIDGAYVEYFLAYFDCLDSEDTTIDFPWDELFNEQVGRNDPVL